MKTTIRQLILKRFREKYLQGSNEFINGQVISDKIHELTHHKHSIVDRELRRLAEEGLLEKTLMTLKIGGTKSIWYKYIPSEQEKKSLLFKAQNKFKIQIIQIEVLIFRFCTLDLF